jgi:uncharacterized protein (DUF58 family)
MTRLPLRPTAAGAFWLLAVLALIATAVNYGNNLIFALAFLLLAVWLQAAWACHRHLAGLAWRANQVEPAFAGESLWLDGRLAGGQPAAVVWLAAGRRHGAGAAFDAGGETLPQLPWPTVGRGELTVADLALQAHWPLGLWQASRPLPALRGLVYPHPAGDLPLPAGNPHTAHRQAATDDFQGLRAYAPGDSPRRINWRVFGRRDELAVNRFDGAAGGEALWLEWDRAAGDAEARLAQLAAWVLAADQAGREYGLRLPGQTLPPARGRPQRGRCLTRLALFTPAASTNSSTAPTS